MVKFSFISLIIVLACSVVSAQQKLKNESMKAYDGKNYARAATGFYRLSREAKSAADRVEAKFFLGSSLIKLELYQVASFPLVSVVRAGNSKYQKRALNQLALIAKRIDEKALLQYSLSKLSPEDLTEMSKAVFYMSMSEIAEFNNKIGEAITWALRAYETDSNNEEAIYQLGSLYLSKPEPSEALKYFSILLERYGSKPITDKKRGLILMNMARTYYQMQNWSEAALYYRQIPKDHFYYQKAQSELSWALFRGGKFRSALSPLQSLMTPFYSHFYDPETLLLSGIILVMSCQNDQAQKISEIYDKNYSDALGQLDVWLKEEHSDEDIYKEMVSAQETLNSLRATGELKSKTKLPFFLLRSTISEADSQSRLRYMKLLEAEGKSAREIFKKSKVTAYAIKILKGRKKAAEKQFAKMVRVHLQNYRNQSLDIKDQFGFLKYEILNGQRIKVRNQIAGQDVVIEDKERSYYAQNGYRFWPMQGEYWRDEIGSYQYVGANLCAK